MNRKTTKKFSPLLIQFQVLVFSSVVLLSCKENNRPDKDLIPDNSGERIVQNARGLEIIKHKDFTEILIKDPWQGARRITMKYIAVREGYSFPAGTKPDNVITVPVRKIVCLSTTHAGMISAIGQEESIKGMAGTQLIYSSSLSAKVSSGELKEVGYESALNQEMILKIDPDLVMIYGVGGESSGHINKLKELGIKIIYNGDYLEKDPLARAEWIKLFGVLYDKEAIADCIYNSVSDNYRELSEFIKTRIDHKPSVLLGLPFKDTWFISPGNSFMNRLIEDAGGNYIWRNTESDLSMPYSLENVYIKALNADYWLNIGTVMQADEILVVDNRLKDLRCFRNGNMFNNNRRLNEAGGNDYWESGSVRTDLILRDIAVILHPELFPQNELVYYQKIK